MAKGAKKLATPKGLTPSTVAPEVAGKVAELKSGGNTCFAKKEYPKAIEQYDAALKLLPAGHADRSDLLCNKAACLYAQNKLKEAVKECGAALEVAPASAKALMYRARALEKQGQLKQALSDVQAVNRLSGGGSATDETREAERRLKDALAGRRPSLANGGARAAGPGGAMAAAARGGVAGGRNSPQSAAAAAAGGAAASSWTFPAKVTLDGETRLVQLGATAGYADLAAAVAAKFPQAAAAVAAGGALLLKVVDREGDLVTVTGRGDVQAALAEAVRGADRRLGLAGVPPIRVIASRAASPADVPPVPYEERAEVEAAAQQRQQQMAALLAQLQKQQQGQQQLQGGQQQQQPEQQQQQKQVTRTTAGEVVEVDDWLVDFAALFREVCGLDTDRHYEAFTDGWAASQRAVEATLRRDEAPALLDRAEERFKEVAASGFVNVGNVELARGQRLLDAAALKEGGEGGGGAAPLGEAVAAEAAGFMAKAEARYLEALAVKPGLFDALTALASLELDRAKLAARLHAKPVPPPSEGGPSDDAAAQEAAAAASREALAGLTAARVDAARPHLAKALEWHAKAAAAADAADEQRRAYAKQDERLEQQQQEQQQQQQQQGNGAANGAANGGDATAQQQQQPQPQPGDDEQQLPEATLASHGKVLHGNALYEWSQMLAAVGDADWRAPLDEAVALFRGAGCAEPDIRAALKNHTRAADLDLGPDLEEEEAKAAKAAKAAEPEPQQAAPAAKTAAADAKKPAPEAKGLPKLERKGGKAANK